MCGKQLIKIGSEKRDNESVSSGRVSQEGKQGRERGEGGERGEGREPGSEIARCFCVVCLCSSILSLFLDSLFLCYYTGLPICVPICLCHEQDSEVNQEYLQSLLKEMSDSPVAVDGSEDEESSGTGSGKGAEDEGSSENSAEEASCKEGKDQSENESDDEDEDESSPTGSSSPESEEEEEETAEPESNSKAGSQAAAVPAAPTEALPGSSLALVAVTADGPAVGAANSIVAARQRVWAGRSGSVAVNANPRCNAQARVGHVYKAVPEPEIVSDRACGLL